VVCSLRFQEATEPDPRQPGIEKADHGSAFLRASPEAGYGDTC